jgi:transcriptional regulatory protein RtcR
MATLAPGGRIGAALVEDEIVRLREVWRRPALRGPEDEGASSPGGEDLVEQVLGEARAADLDPFDRVQLAEVIRVCRASRSLSEAGRSLFSASRGKKTSVNDADRLRKYLAKLDLDWSAVTRG